MHEIAYPWGLGGVRGGAWALTHRVALIGAVRACCGAVVTTEERMRWLSSRRWLPRRPVSFAPVFSNLPAPAARRPWRGETHTIGLFGYSYRENASTLVLESIRALREEGLLVHLALLGAPGRASVSGEAWLEHARALGVAEALSFSEALPAQSLADALAACAVLLVAHPPGPSSRRGSLAASLASGRPV